jgi:hypothetical protein
MDRDVVNLIHFLYQHGAADWGAMRELLWCSQDTLPPARAFMTSDERRLPDQLISFIKAIEEQVAGLPRPEFAFGYPLSQPLRRPGEARRGFVAMPYTVHWFETVKETILDAGAAAGFRLVVSLDMGRPGAIVDQVWAELRQSEAVIADLTGCNPNVFYEVGLAHALGKEVILLTQDERALPFDVVAQRRISYTTSRMPELKESLVAAFKSVPPRYPSDAKRL